MSYRCRHRELLWQLEESADFCLCNFTNFLIFLENFLLKITLFQKNDYKIGNTSSYQLPLTFISNHLAGNRVIFNKILFKNKKFVKLTRSKSALSSNCPQSQTSRALVTIRRKCVPTSTYAISRIFYSIFKKWLQNR